ncbi:unnamed protein product [Prunus armeniaca]
MASFGNKRQSQEKGAGGNPIPAEHDNFRSVYYTIRKHMDVSYLRLLNKRYPSHRQISSPKITLPFGAIHNHQRCLGDYVLREIHSRVCGDHSGSQSLAHKAFQQGYYWPTTHQDANMLVKKCDKCQRFGNVPHIPTEPLSPIVSPWPFAQWGLDLIGPMLQGKGQVKYVVVAVDYFTKWVEVEALATITAARMEDFIWTNNCCRFGIPYAIIIDNGRQFDSEIFR